MTTSDPTPSATISSAADVPGPAGTGADTPSIDAVVARFADLPTMAPAVMQLLELLGDDEVEISELTRVIGTDPGLAVRLLQLVNSAAYRQGQGITSLDQAAMILGLRTLKMAALSFVLVGQITTPDYDGALLWRRSLATGVLARRLVERREAGMAVGRVQGVDQTRAADPEVAQRVESAFVAGLLSNLGKMALVGEPTYRSLLDEHGPWVGPVRERRTLGFTSDEASARILTAWGLPPSMSQAVAARPKVTVDPVTGTTGNLEPTLLGVVLALADTMAVLLLADGSVRARAFDRVTLLAAAHVGMTVGQVERMLDTASEELDELADGCGLSPISSNDVAETIEVARIHLVRMSLGTVEALAEEKVRNHNLRRTNARLATAAATDALTGLPNRRTFNAYLAHQRGSWTVRPDDSMLGLLLIDLDDFKQLNDHHGHLVGDEVLSCLGERLLAGCRRGELASRIGGDEFALIMPDLLADDLAGAARRIRGLIVDAPFETSIGPLVVRASVGGASVSPADWSASAEGQGDLRHLLLRGADRALYEAKKRDDGLALESIG